MKLYHFCAFSQNADGSLSYFDGTYKSNDDFGNKEVYQVFKTLIGKTMDPPKTKITISSLSLIKGETS